jgi:CheY-like chemotaxis protein
MDIQDTSTWRILIVDDEPDNLEVVAESLQFFGATVKIARNGQIGLKELEEFPANFILLDLSMPVMDGWEMRSRVKSNPKTKHIPVIALSAHAMAGDKERAMDAGFDGYLTKPVNVPTLLADLREVFQSAQAKEAPATTDATPEPEATATEATTTEATAAEATAANGTATSTTPDAPLASAADTASQTNGKKDTSIPDVNINANAGGVSQ